MAKKNKLTELFGKHPKSLFPLVSTEIWERFSYCGMRAILLFYIYFAISKGGLGLPQATAASIVAIYGALVYLSGLLGGFLSDYVLGSYKTVLYGGILIMMGHISLIFPGGLFALFISLTFIIIGSGLLKPNASNMVGGSYEKSDINQDSGFIFLVFGLNFGALVAPLIVGWVADVYNFHLGFLIAALGMFTGLLIFRSSKNKFNSSFFYPTNHLSSKNINGLITKSGILIFILVVAIVIMMIFHILKIENLIKLISISIVLLSIFYFGIILGSKKITKKEHSQVLAYIPLFMASILFWIIEEQGSTILALFAENNVIHTGIPTPWFQSLNPLFVILYTPFFLWLWNKLAKRQPSTPSKFSLGLFFGGLSFLFMLIPISLYGRDILVSPLWLVGSWGIAILGLMLIFPIGLSVASKLAPTAFKAQFMGLNFLAIAVGQAINSQIVHLYIGNEFTYFAIVGSIPIIGGIIIFLSKNKIKSLMGDVM
ncbi:MAG: oligopeptide:H+ symporter [Methanobrevibacter sp.]|jgi:POT family proton-dependent oligopeptide transporter|nr:oligopeptide:H+ symporter [Methanobrevibacter sp.]